jgi:hypothetical protein
MDTEESPQPELEPLDDVDLDVVVGGMRSTGYLCTATSGGVSEDCWQQ